MFVLFTLGSVSTCASENIPHIVLQFAFAIFLYIYSLNMILSLCTNYTGLDLQQLRI